MLDLIIPSREFYNETTQEFINTREWKLKLVHSLVSVSKWESKWKKAFLTTTDRTNEETLDYIRCMTVTQNIPDEAYKSMSVDNLRAVNDYISNTMSATIISKNNKQAGGVRETVTSEIIYGWMISLGIPFECQKWHLNRLLTLINVCNIQNSPPEKMGRQEILRRNRALNEKRKQQLKTRG